MTELKKSSFEYRVGTECTKHTDPGFWTSMGAIPQAVCPRCLLDERRESLFPGSVRASGKPCKFKGCQGTYELAYVPGQQGARRCPYHPEEPELDVPGIDWEHMRDAHLAIKKVVMAMSLPELVMAQREHCNKAHMGLKEYMKLEGERNPPPLDEEMGLIRDAIIRGLGVPEGFIKLGPVRSATVARFRDRVLGSIRKKT